jgi:hypothetical protein
MIEAFPETPETLKMARRVMWYEEPEDVLKKPVLLLAHILQYGTHEDISVMHRYCGIDDLTEFLADAPAGILDERSWTYWHLVADISPVPPMPERSFDIEAREQGGLHPEME